MIFYLLRIAVVLLRQALKPRVRPTDTVEVRFRAWPWSCDLNLHLNNAQALVLMELGRWAYTLRTGVLRRVLSGRVQLLIAGASVLYRRPIGLGRSFTLRTRVLAADQRWIYFLQEIVDDRQQVALRAVLRGLARQRGQTLSAVDLFGVGSLAQLEGSDEVEAFERLAQQHLAQLDDGAAHACVRSPRRIERSSPPPA